jgi:hypothetical protein
VKPGAHDAPRRPGRTGTPSRDGAPVRESRSHPSRKATSEKVERSSISESRGPNGQGCFGDLIREDLIFRVPGRNWCAEPPKVPCRREHKGESAGRHGPASADRATWRSPRQAVFAPRAEAPERSTRMSRRQEAQVDSIERCRRTRSQKSAERNRITLRKKKPKEAARACGWKHPGVKADSTSGPKP